jgi:hypothetical protein
MCLLEERAPEWWAGWKSTDALDCLKPLEVLVFELVLPRDLDLCAPAAIWKRPPFLLSEVE